MHIRGTQLLLASLATGFGLGLAACSQSDNPEPSTSAVSSSAESTLMGRDLDIAEANCRAYESAVSATREFHSAIEGEGVRDTIGNWMAMYEEGQAGLVVTPVPTAPELNQAITRVSDQYGDMLEKLDVYTMATDMSADVRLWNGVDERVVSLCDELAP
jgi:hypothetical protein